MPFMPAITADVSDSTATSNTDITNLNFPATAGRMYWFRAVIPYTAAATTTGAEFGVDVPGTDTATFLAFGVSLPTGAATEAFQNYGGATGEDDQVPATDSATTAGNIAIVEGMCRPLTSGAVQFRMDTEVGTSAITAKAGAFVEFRDLTQ